MDSHQVQTEMDRIYTAYSIGFREIGNIRASNGYAVCKLINQHICTSFASWISTTFVDKWISLNEWQLFICQHQRTGLVDQGTAKT